MNADSRVEVLETMRGLASAAVAWFHFTNGGALLADGWLKTSGAYGWLGVEVFFVISGFVLPFSLRRGGYCLRRDAGTFLLKRLVRLEPPYLVTLGLTVGLLYVGAAVPGFQGSPPNVTPTQLLLHVGYLNGYLGYPSLSPVFWTLAIEFQFYLLVAVAYPLLASGHRVVAAGSLAVLGTLALAMPHERFVFAYLGLFGLGIAAFRLYAGLNDRLVFFAVAAGLTAVNAMVLSPLVAGVGLFAAAAIIFVRGPRYPALAALGAVSYSLYLLHVPIGGRIVNLGTRFAQTPPTQVLVLAAAAAASLVAACGLCWLVEGPAQRWSSRLRYGPRKPKARIPETSFGTA